MVMLRGSEVASLKEGESWSCYRCGQFNGGENGCYRDGQFKEGEWSCYRGGLV